MDVDLEDGGIPLIRPDKLMVFGHQYIYQDKGVGIFHGLFESRKRVAVKRLELTQNVDLDKKLLKEAQIMLDMGEHPNILRCYCFYKDQDFL